MYQNHFRLTGEPFALTPDPTFLFLSNGHSEALAALRVGMAERRGFIVMIGEVGTGKTTLLYSLLSSMQSETHTAYVSNTTLSFDGILRSALRDFGVKWNGPDKVDLLEALNGFLWKCAERNETAALVVDEAQNLSDEAFEELRLLSNFETFKAKLLQIVLVGQPELDIKLRQPRLRQVAERVAVWCHVNPLSAQEARGYIQHRLEAVGGSLEVFTEPALRLLVRKSRRIPRRINILCHNAMLFAYGRNLKRVTRSVVAAAIREREGSNLVSFSPGFLRRTGLAARTLPAFATDGSGKLTPLVTWATAGLAIGSLITMLTLSADSRSTATDRSKAGSVGSAATAVVEPSTPAPPRASDPRAHTDPAPDEGGNGSGAPRSATEAAVTERVAAVRRADTSPVAESEGASDPERAIDRVAREVDRAAAAPREVAAARLTAPAASTGLPASVEPTPSATADGESDSAATARPATAQPASAAAVAKPALEPPAKPGPAIAAAPAPRVPPAPVPVPRVPEPANGVTTEERTVAATRITSASRNPETDAAHGTPASEATSARVAEARAPERTASAALPSSTATLRIDGADDSYRTIGVPAGTTLSDLTVRVYGEYTTALLRLIQDANPQLVNPDHIIAGEEIRFPELDSTFPGNTGAEE